MLVVLFMVLINNDTVQTEWVFSNKDFNVPLNHRARFFVDFMEEFMDEYGLTDGENKVGRSSYSPRSMLKLIVYAKTNHVTCSDVIADYALYHDVYKYVCDYITPSAKSIRRFKRDFKSIYNDILKKTLKKAEEEDLTSFNHIPVDGTIKKAYNNLHNIITEKETDLLLEYYNGEEIEEEKLEKLHRSVKKFMENEKLCENEKISLLKRIKKEFTKTEQDKIPLNDIEARKMKGKRGNFKYAYNMQSAVDSETGLICAITISQSPTDHYELPSIVTKAINNIGKKPEYVSADTIYLQNPNVSFLIEQKINGLIPNRTQSKKDTKRLNKNPYHKDHFEYNPDTDSFKCP
jgi:transposase